MERDLSDASDFGRDDGPDIAPARDSNHDIADDAPGLLRDTAPDVLAPIDSSAPVSGHVVAREHRALAAETPEHDWSAASTILVPLLRPSETQGMKVTEIDLVALAADATRSHSQPLLDEGPCDLSVVYAMPGPGFDVIVNGGHLLSWGTTVGEVQDAALANLRAWSTTAAWTDEVSGERHLISSDTGDGWDAARILLPEVRDRLVSELGAIGRILIGLPERHLLVAAALRPADDEFAALFAEFVLEQSGAADEPVDRRVFELVDGQLVEFRGPPALA